MNAISATRRTPIKLSFRKRVSILIGLLGIFTILSVKRLAIFRRRSDARSYLIFFIAVGLVRLGSASYHWAPSNERLLWDRLPMSIGFMAF